MNENKNLKNEFLDISNENIEPVKSEEPCDFEIPADENKGFFRKDISLESELELPKSDDTGNMEDEFANSRENTDQFTGASHETPDNNLTEEASEGTENESVLNRIESGQNGKANYEYSWLNQNPQAEKKNTDFHRENNYNDFSGQKQNQKFNYTHAEKPKHKNTFGKIVAMAVVFGLVAGLVSFGVNYAGAKLTGTSQSVVTAPKIATTETTDTNQTLDEALNETTHNEANTPSRGTVAEVAKNSLPALTTISVMSVQEMESFFGMTESYEVEGAGTGVIVGQNDSELLIATNNHVVEDATKVTVGFVDEQVTEAFVKGTDPENDLAVVGVKLENIPEETMQKIKIATIGESDDLQLGEQVVAIGNALGFGQSVTSGYISGLDRELELTDGTNTFKSTGLIQTDAAINSGNSGGALLNMSGELIGINEAKSSSSEFGASVDNVAYAIPISKAEPILQELMNLETKEKVSDDERGYLGVTCADVNQGTSERYNIPVGVYVREVVDNGPAAECGILVGDVITKFDGRIVNSYEKLVEALSYCKAGEEVDLIVQRSENGKYAEQTLTVKLGEASVLDELSFDEKPQMNNKSNIQIGN